MKFIRSVLLMTALLGIQAGAQQAPPSPSSAPLTPTPTAHPLPANHPVMVTNTGVIHSPMPTTPPPLPEKEKTSYAIGMSVGGSIKRQGIEVDMDTVVTAMKDALAGVTNHMTEAEMRSTLQQVGAAVRYKMQEEQRVKMEKEEAENKVKGDAFLASNAKVEGVKTLPDGLQYKVLKEGAGEQPKTNEVLTLNYKGTLVDGTSFDSHTNFTVPLNGRGLIKGWLDVLPMMKPGAEWQIVVPPDLGYGPKGHPPKIGPGAVLVFDMELVSVAPPKLPAVTSAPAAPNAAPAATGPTAVSGQIIRVPSAEEMKKGQKIEVITNVPPGQ